MTTTPAEEIIAQHMLVAMRDVLGLIRTPPEDWPDEVHTTAAIVAAECIAELANAGHVSVADAMGRSW